MDRERLTSFPVLDGLIVLSILAGVVAAYSSSPRNLADTLFLISAVLIVVGGLIATGSSRYQTAERGKGYGAMESAETVRETRNREIGSGIRLMVIGGMLATVLAVLVLLHLAG